MSSGFVCQRCGAESVAARVELDHKGRRRVGRPFLGPSSPFGVPLCRRCVGELTENLRAGGEFWSLGSGPVRHRDGLVDLDGGRS